MLFIARMLDFSEEKSKNTDQSKLVLKRLGGSGTLSITPPNLLATAMSIVRSPYWLFTINNPTESPQFDDVKYMIYQFEQGEQGTVHIQGYVVFNCQKRQSTVKKMEPRAHLEVRRGTHEQAKAYCSKLDTRIEGPIIEGDDSSIMKQQPGKRSDCADVIRLIKEGASNALIFESHPNSIRYYKGLDFARAAFKEHIKRNWKTRVIVYYGVAGSGKSYTVQQLAGPDAYFKPPGHKWFDAYEGQEIVVFDEFRGNWFDLSTFLRIMDAYPLRVEMKGSTIEFVARTLYITSNVAPESWYPNIDAIQLAALLRRLDEVHHFINAYQANPPVAAELLQDHHQLTPSPE